MVIDLGLSEFHKGWLAGGTLIFYCLLIIQVLMRIIPIDYFIGSICGFSGFVLIYLGLRLILMQRAYNRMIEETRNTTKKEDKN